ncbi:alpha/beta hydrolase [Catenulispora subtropica]|uniref:Alpha/beta hydrolase n=1 Tax=Catenulispora subtropica TaxID=450798 RepID=A0ABN2QFR4_9ACTN
MPSADPKTEQLAALWELVALAEGATVLPDLPTTRPAEGETRERWIEEVVRRRSQHEANALESYRRSGASGRIAHPVASATYHAVPVKDGVITVRVYKPEGDGPHPALALLHGGAWWLGAGPTNFELNDLMCRYLCAEAGTVIANVDYRLAPEHPWPTQVEDSAAAVAWLAADPDGIGIAADRLGILGISSGGNVAACVTRLLRATGPTLKMQVLLAPSLDMTGSSESLAQDGFMPQIAAVLRDQYLQGQVEPGDPRVSPVLADDLDDLPPAVIVVGSEDPLRDDGKRYHARLQAFGGSSELHEFVMTHTVATDDVVDALYSMLAKAIRSHLAG